MKSLLSLFGVAALAAGLQAAPSPLRVLYLGQDGTHSTDHCHVLMRELGRDAIWFDYTADPAQATAEWASRFDAILLDAPAASFPAVATGAKVVKPSFTGTAATWASAEFLKSVRLQVTGAAGEARTKEWENFVGGREPEKRNEDSNVANYENRPKAITFQHPFSVEGSKQRTQVPVDMKLELFAAEPDISKPIAFAWDERGRLWVCETRDYPHGVVPTGEGNDSIKICEDTDGDGRADKFTIFADKLNIPTSLVSPTAG